MDWFWQCWVNSISTLSEIICIFNFPCPFTFTYFICFKSLLRKWCNTGDLNHPHTKCQLTKLLVTGKAAMCMREGERTSLGHAWWNYSLPKLARFFETQCSIIASLVVTLFNCSISSSTYQASSFQLISLVTVQYLHLQCSENRCNTNKAPFYEWLTSIGWHGGAIIHVSDLHSTCIQLSAVTLLRLAVWLRGNTLVSINVVVLRQTRLVPGRVTVCGWVKHLGM